MARCPENAVRRAGKVYRLLVGEQRRVDSHFERGADLDCPCDESLCFLSVHTVCGKLPRSGEKGGITGIMPECGQAAHLKCEKIDGCSRFALPVSRPADVVRMSVRDDDGADLFRRDASSGQPSSERRFCVSGTQRAIY